MPRREVPKKKTYRCPKCGAGLKEKFCLECRVKKYKKRPPIVAEGPDDNCDFGAEYLPSLEQITLDKAAIRAANEGGLRPSSHLSPAEIRTYAVKYQRKTAVIKHVG